MRHRYALLIAPLLLPAVLLAQPGGLDPTFDPLAGPNNWVYSMVEQPDGKVIIGGEFTSYNGVPRNRIARINTDGSLDASFNPGSGADGTVNSLALQADGKVVVGGWFNTFNGTNKNRLMRLNTDGSLDNSLDVGTGFNSQVEVVTVLGDGRILVGGAFWNYNGTVINRAVMLQSTGLVDDAFTTNLGTAANYNVKHLSVMPDARIVVAGEFTTWNSAAAGGMVMLNANGTLAAGFNAGSGANGSVMAVLALPDGDLLVGGDFTMWNGAARNRLVRVDPNGALDMAWGLGSGASSTVRHLFRQDDGRIVVAGSFTSLFGSNRTRVARLLPNGIVESGFDPGTGPNLDVECALLVGSDRILIGGNFSSYTGTPRTRLARIKACLPTPVVVNDPELTASEPVGPYQWIDCSTGLPIANATQQTFTPTANGSYAVTTTSNGCAITSDCYPVNSVGITTAHAQEVRAWPNPASDRLWVEGSTAGTFDLLSMDCRVVIQGRMTPGMNSVDLSTVPTGSYTLSIASATDRRVIRVMVAR